MILHIQYGIEVNNVKMLLYKPWKIFNEKIERLNFNNKLRNSL